MTQLNKQILKIINEEIDVATQKLQAIKMKADHIRAKADLLRAKNQLTLAKINKNEIKQKIKSKKSDDIKVQSLKTNKEVDLNSGKPLDEEQSTKKEIDLNSGDPLTTNEDILISNKELSSVNEEENDESDAEQTDDKPSFKIAGSEPETKEEAEIARIQAHTREIQARTGEYNAPGGMNQDGATGEDGEMDPNAMGMDPSLMQGEPQKPDPLKGFGDTTDPANNNMMGGMMGGMPNIDPMTGQPVEQGPSKTLSALGRLYELKKIYYRLNILSKIASRTSDSELDELRKDINELMDVFTMICSNLKSYKDTIDDIIVNYYIFIKDTSKRLEDHILQKKLESEYTSE